MNRITFTLLSLLACPLTAHAEEGWEYKTLFLDDHHVAEMSGLRRVMHRPMKKGPVFLPRGETDGIRVQTASAPVWVPEENVFKLFYMGFPYRKHGWIVGEIGSALAVSKDGLDWKRPVLKQVEIGGSTANNRFFVVDQDLRWAANKLMEVIHDPHDSDPQRRYKGLLGAIGRKPVVSPDGIHWKTIGAKTIPSSDTSTLIYDELGRRYLAILKKRTKFGRSAAVAFSTDFKTWTTPRTLIRRCRIRSSTTRTRRRAGRLPVSIPRSATAKFPPGELKRISWPSSRTKAFISGCHRSTTRPARPCQNETTRSAFMKSNWLSTAILCFPARAGSDSVIGNPSSRRQDSTRDLRVTLTVSNSEFSIGRS